MKEIILKTKKEDETTKIGEKIGKFFLTKSPAPFLILINGELGAGKTTLIKGISKGIGVNETVESPTFVFLTIHKGKITLYHFDLYRVSSLKELDEIGFFETLNINGIIVVEWGDKLRNIVNEDLLIKINKIGEKEREIYFKVKNNIIEDINEYIINKSSF